MDVIHYDPLLNVSIDSKARGNKNTKKNFLGVFSADNLPVIQRKPCSLVVNTDVSSKPGEHWVSMFIPKRGALEYFDSFGREPHIKQHIEFIENNCNEYRFNAASLQSRESSLCGHYCLMYIFHRSIGKSMKNFVDKFPNSNHYSNDAKLMLMFRKVFGNVRAVGGGGKSTIRCVPRCACAVECARKKNAKRTNKRTRRFDIY